MSENAISTGAAALDAANTSADTAPVAESAPAQAPVSQPETQSQGNPAWQDILGKIPEGFHPIVKPAFEEWDKGVQERFAKVHSQYEPYKPIMESGLQPEDLSQAVQLFQLLQNDPEAVYKAMAENFGFGGEQGQAEDEDDEYDLGGQGNPDLSKDPRFQQLEQQQQMLMQNLQAAQQAEIARQADTWLDTQIKSATDTLSQAGIEPDKSAMEYILGLAHARGEVTGNAEAAFNEAVQSYVGMVNNIRGGAPQRSAPTVMPTGGGTPSSRVSPSEMSDKERKTLGSDWLNQALGNS